MVDHVNQSSSEGGDESAEQAPASKPKKKQRSFWKELPILIGVALVLAFLIQQFIGRPYMIPSGSMEQTLHGCPGCTGDRVLVDKVTYLFTDPSPGDVVVFKGPQPWTENDAPSNDSSNPIAGFFRQIGSVVGLAPPDEKDFVKRVIAVGGQTVECCDDNNRVLVDGQPLDEPYIYWEPGSGNEQAEFDPVRVPDDSVWMMGDNRNNSSDSRYQGGGGARGAVPLDNVIGKARVIVLPPSRWQGVSDHDPQEAAMPAAAPGTFNAPAWQQGLPAAIGVAGAWPALWAGRRTYAGIVRVWRRSGP
ncbi:signal peptidase I [Tamaricihabitans halophyticus]|uniref:Signal peptidase I n=1 Tax=Tamaricihabitans halophyticus TaxID=1262583 RepID=A0A4R2QSM7_9PSEU|nr:signal peptidase I [Tamaricihabitans halophyticus]TCP51969.1 signal peptidase I [Tamaricihabitans halophyticus]